MTLLRHTAILVAGFVGTLLVLFMVPSPWGILLAATALCVVNLSRPLGGVT